MAGTKQRASILSWGTYLLFLVVFTGVYFHAGASALLENRTEPVRQGQNVQLSATLRARTTDADEPTGMNAPGSATAHLFPHRTDGISDPLFPWVAGFFHSEDPTEILEKGQWLNLCVSGAFLVVLGLVAAKAFSLWSGAAIVILGATGVFLERAALFLPDIFLHVFMTLLWIAALSLLRRNNLWLFGVLGVLFGLVFLTDSLIWPVAAAFLGTVALQTAAPFFSRKKRRDRSTGEEREDDPANLSGRIVGLAIAVTAFGIVAGPRLSYAADRFGSAFHATSNYTMWLDSPEEAKAFRAGHRDAESLAAAGWREGPGLYRYLKDRGPGALAERIWRGLRGDAYVFLRGGIRPLLAWVLLLSVALAVLHRRARQDREEQVWRVGGTNAHWMMLFVVAAFGLTLLHTSIGRQAHPADLRIVALFLPVLVAALWIANRLRRQLRRTRHAKWADRLHLLMTVVPVVVVVGKLGMAFRI